MTDNTTSEENKALQQKFTQKDGVGVNIARLSPGAR